MDEKKYEPFDEILEIVGNNGKFQCVYKYLLVLGSALCSIMIYMNIILALNIPDHWCFVPGRNETNLTVTEWRNLTIPLEINSKGESSFSTCLMYNQSFTDLEEQLYEVHDTKISCLNGYEYDTKYYDESIPMKENWVCDKDLYVTQIYMISRIVEVAGTLLLGHCGDIIGRRMTYFICLGISLLGRVLSILTTHSYLLFLITNSISGFAVLTLFQSPFVVGMEISRDIDRAEIKILHSVGWTLSTIIMPLIYWWFRHWNPFMWLTSLPVIALLFFPKYMIESPRWLINEKKFKQASIELKKIAKINKRTFNLTEEKIAEMFNDVKKETTYGFASFFGSFRLAKNTLILSYSLCMILLSYFTLLLLSSKIGGDPFRNFLVQSVVDLPAYFVGMYLANRIGRRLTHIVTLCFSALIFVPISLLVLDSNNEIYVIVLVTSIQFLNGVGFFVLGLQSIEIFPTCLRQTGLSIGYFLSNIGGIAAPTLVYIGTNHNIQAPYIILGILNLIAAIGSLFLPETLNCKLPDTVDDTKYFGKSQSFWSYPRNNEKIDDKNITEKDEEEKLKPEINHT